MTRFLLFAALCSISGGTVYAQVAELPVDDHPPGSEEPAVVDHLRDAARNPAIEPLGEGRFRIGNLVVDKRKRELHMNGAFATVSGPLEYLACAPGGKLYESLLRIDVDPYHLHLGLLLIGLEPENNLEYQGDPNRPAGNPVTIWITWDEQNGRVSHRAEKLIWRQSSNCTMAETVWVFSGSLFREGTFMAAVDRSLVAVYNDPHAIINNPLPTGGDDTSYVANPEILPAEGTEVQMVVKATGPGAEDS